MCSVEEEAVAEVDVGEKGPRCWELQTQAMGLRPDWEHSKESKKKAFLKRLFYKGKLWIQNILVLRQLI